MPRCAVPSRCAVALLLACGVALVPATARAGFTDVSDTALTWPSIGITYGLGWADFDVDGDPDCFVCRHFERPILYRNLGNGTLTYLFYPPLFDTALDHHGPLIADFDEDGDPDIYLTGGADAGFGDSLKKLYRNDGLDVDGLPRFVDVAEQWGLTDLLARGRSSSGMDVDADGDLDIFVAKASRIASPNSLFLNDGSQHFVDVASSAGLADDFGCVGGLWADYDRDGDPDLLIGGEEEVSFETRLYRNDGNLTFTNVTAQMLPGIGQIAAAAWGDADNDGDLDLAIGLGDRALFDAVYWTPDSLRYFFNTRFGDNGLDGVAFTQTGDSATYNITLDGYYQSQSVFISAAAYHPALIPFSVSEEIHGAPPFLPGQSLATYLWTETLFPVWQMRCNAPPEAGHAFAGIITTNGDFTDVSIIGVEPYTHGERGTRLWRNDGSVFRDVSANSGLTDTVNVHCLQWVDVDQDGRLDLYVENKGDTQVLNQPNLYYHNLGSTRFQNEAPAQGLEGPHIALGDSFGFEDYDLDGDLDVLMLEGCGPRFLAQPARVRLYRNEGPTGHRLRVHLEGLWSTPDGYGAWVTCVAPTSGRQVRYVTGNTWRGCPTMLDPYFGLGADTSVDSLIVEWPSGATNVLLAVPAGDVTVVESDPLVGVETAPAAALAELRLVAAPNPASGSVVFVAEGRRPNRLAKLVLIDAGGRKVFSRELPAGADRFAWDGRDAGGHPVAAGVYFARLSEGERATDAKIVHLGR